MFGLGWTEILVIAAIAVLIVPTKDLPALMRNVGQGVGKMRRMATQFQRELDTALRDEELDKLRRDVTKIGQDTERDLRNTGSRYQRDVKAATPIGELEEVSRETSQIGNDLERELQSSGAVGRAAVKRSVTVEKPEGESGPPMAPIPAAPETPPAEQVDSELPEQEVGQTVAEPAKS